MCVSHYSKNFVRSLLSFASKNLTNLPHFPSVLPMVVQVMLLQNVHFTSKYKYHPSTLRPYTVDTPHFLHSLARPIKTFLICHLPFVPRFSSNSYETHVLVTPNCAPVLPEATYLLLLPQRSFLTLNPHQHTRLSQYNKLSLESSPNLSEGLLGRPCAQILKPQVDLTQNSKWKSAK